MITRFNTRLIIILLTAIACFAGGILQIHKNGFFSHVPSLLVLLGFFLLLILPFYWHNKKKKGKGYGVALILGLSIAFMLSEISLRVWPPDSFPSTGIYYLQLWKQTGPFYHTRKPNTTVDLTSAEFSHKRTTNSLGLSDKEPDTIATANKKLILSLGDSFTEGFGAHADSTWMKFLERQTANHSPDSFAFLNAGVSGSDPFYNYVLLKDKLLPYNPAIVIVTYGYDLDDIIVRGGMERFGTDAKAHFRYFSYTEPFYALSYTFRLLVHEAFGLNHLFMSEKNYENALEIAVETLRESIFFYRGLADVYNFRLLFVFYPQRHNILNGHYGHLGKLVDYTKLCRFHVLDLNEYFINSRGINQTNINNFVWPDDGHYKAAGNQMFGQAVFEKLKQLGWL